MTVLTHPPFQNGPGRALRNLGPGRNRKIYLGEGSTNFSFPRPLPELPTPGIPIRLSFSWSPLSDYTLCSPSPETYSVWKAHLCSVQGYPILLQTLKEAAESVLSYQNRPTTQHRPPSGWVLSSLPARCPCGWVISRCADDLQTDGPHPEVSHSLCVSLEDPSQRSQVQWSSAYAPNSKGK